MYEHFQNGFLFHVDENVSTLNMAFFYSLDTLMAN